MSDPTFSETAVAATILRRAAELRDAPAVICDGVVLTWSALGDQAARVAGGLRALGCAPGDRIAVLMGNAVENVVASVGALAAGMSVAPLPGMVSAEAIALMLADCGAKAIVCDAAGAAQIDASVGEAARSAARFIVGGAREGWSPFDAWVSAQQPIAAAAVSGPDAEFGIIYSSGTTGSPKGIVISQGMRVDQCRAMAMGYGFGAQTRALIGSGLYSNLGATALYAALYNGGVALMSSKLTPSAFTALAEHHRPTHAFLVPIQIERMLAHPDFDAHRSSLEMMKVSAGSLLRAAVKREVLERWPGGLIEIYGMTEGAPVVMLVAHAHADKLDSVGRVVHGEARVIDDAGQELPAGEIGEIVGWNPRAMSGYHNRPEATQALIWRSADGKDFLRTGDVGRIDADGFVYLLDRKKDMIISGGLNVYATDLERVLSEHPHVAEVAVVGVPSTRWGETPVAVVVAKAGQAANADAIRDWANARLGKVQRLAAVVLAPELPRGALEKVLKRELRDRYRHLGDSAA